MNDYYNGFDDFDRQSQEMLKALQNFAIPVNNLQSKGYGKIQDIIRDKILLGETQRGMNNVSPFVAYKFYNQTSDEVFSKYFVDAPPPEEGAFTYVSDVRSDLREYIKDINDFYYYGKVDKEHFAFKVILFSSTETSKLKECFDVCKPKGNEILIFVEDNTTDYVSGTYGAIRISDDLLKFFNERNLKYKNTNIDFLSYDFKDNQNVYEYLKNQKIGLTDEQISQLFHDGYIEDTKIGIAKKLFSVASFLSSGLFSINPALGIFTNEVSRALMSKVLQSAIEEIEKGRLPENYWQPNPSKDEKGVPDKNYQYQPIISIGNENAKIDIASVINALNKKADEQLMQVKGILKISKDLNPDDTPKDILEFLYLNYFRAYKVAKGVIAQVEEIGKSEILRYGAKAYNALLCGVWNGLVDAVSGLFAMVKMIFDGISLGADFAKNIDKYLPTLLEQFDETLQAIRNLSFAKVANYISGKLKQINLIFDPIACAYFVGYAYGFIISLIIEIVLTIITTGGSLTIPVIVEKVEEALFGIFRLGCGIAKGTVKAIRTFAKFVVKSIEDVINGFQELLRFLKGEKGSFKKIIDEVFEASNIKKIGEFGGKVLSEAEIEDWAKLVMKKFGTNLKKVNGFDEPNVLAQFNPNTNTIEYMDDVTEYLMAHESFHAEEMHKLGFDNFVKDCPLKGVKQKDYTPENWIRLYKREKYVYDRIIENKKILKLSEDELEHADLYIEVIQLRMKDRGIKF